MVQAHVGPLFLLPEIISVLSFFYSSYFSIFDLDVDIQWGAYECFAIDYKNFTDFPNEEKKLLH